MRKCLFDTNAVSLMLSDRIPEKWVRYSTGVREWKIVLLLSEPLISEIFYKNVSKFGHAECRKHILLLKSLSHVEIHSLTDSDAINAGEIKIRLSQYGLSLVDYYLLSIGRPHKSIILTTDHGVKDAGRKIGVEINYYFFTD